MGPGAPVGPSWGKDRGPGPGDPLHGLRRVVKMLEDVFSSPLVKDVARLIEKRLGRKLEPFDVWASTTVSAPAQVWTRPSWTPPSRGRAPHRFRLQEGTCRTSSRPWDSPEERAQRLAGRIEVDPARGSGHAMGAQRRGDNAPPAHARGRQRHGLQGLQYRRPREWPQR